MVLGYAVQDCFLASEGDCGGAGNSGTAGKVRNRVLRHLGTWTDEAHVSCKHVEELRQLIQFPTSKERPDGREALVSGGCNRLMGLI